MKEQVILLVLGSLFSAGTIGQIIMYVIKKHDRLDKVEKVVERLAEGVTLGLENDIVIFNALRNNHINGESEKQEQKMRTYFKENSNRGLEL